MASNEAETAADDVQTGVDLELTANDQISNTILAQIKEHGLAALVKALLEAQGYTVFMPPEGPDKGVDLLAAPGALSFGSPGICVQVKPTDSPIDRVILDQLVGVMQNFHADQGLLVAGAGLSNR